MHRRETKHIDTLKESPAKNASFLSIVTFWWLRDLITTGYRRPLTSKDMYKCLDEERSSAIQDRYLRLWQEEKTRRKPSVLHLFWRARGPQTLLIGLVFSFVETTLRVASPLLLGRLLSYFSPDSDVTLREAYWCASGIVFCSLVLVVQFHHYTGYLQSLGYEMKVCVAHLIYDKILRLRKSCLVDGLSGKAINLLGNNAWDYANPFFCAHGLWKGPFETIVLGYFIYGEMGLAGLGGIGLIMLLIPLQKWVGTMAAKYAEEVSGLSDSRLQLMNEIVQGIMVIKMYAWESPFAKMVRQARETEMEAVKKGVHVNVVFCSLYLFSRVTIFLSVMAYVFTGNVITARKIFIVSTFYSILSDSMVNFLPNAIASCAEGYVMFSRIQDFLLLRETKPESKLAKKEGNTRERRFHDVSAEPKGVRLEGATTYWALDGDYATPNLWLANMEVKSSELCTIVGPVGSGKSTLLQVILGELELDSGAVFVNGSLSYGAQEPWLFDGTIRQNILFSANFDEERYQEVLRVCALDRDIEVWPHGDQTIVGERGVILSGGQKARVSLARAVYREADIYLLDDPLSAVDAHVGRHIFDHCIRGFLAGKTVVLVTHQLQFLKDVEHIVLMNNACIEAQGTYEELKTMKASILSLLPHIRVPEESRKEKASKQEEKAPHEPQKVEEEDVEFGKASWGLLWKYVQSAKSPFWMAMVVLTNVSVQLSNSFVDYFVSSWTDWETSAARNETPSFFMLSPERSLNHNRVCIAVVYSILVVLASFLTLARNFSFFHLGLLASKNIHDWMFQALSKAPMRFFHTNSSGRILSRFGYCMKSLDCYFPENVNDLIVIFLEVAGVCFLVVMSNSWLFIPTAAIFVFCCVVRTLYARSSQQIKRFRLSGDGPMLSHVNATFAGAATIRAFGAHRLVQEELGDLHDDITIYAFPLERLKRGVRIWIDVACVLFVATTIFSFLVFDPKSSGNVGLAITQAMALTGMLQWGVLRTAEVEQNLTTVERVQQYLELPSESQGEKPRELPKKWPSSGKIEFKGLSFRYHEKGDRILKDVTFTAESREKVGIVGRTGAGKSSIVQALFRLAPIEGTIEIDGIDTKSLSLKDLRRNISIIPQDPVLFSGTIRSNLDPFNDCSDEEIWSALDHVELKGDIESLPGELLCKVADGGSNFSMGERQLICLARAILRRNQILVLDEATANVDPETDRLIQKTIRSQFSHCTVLTIAHRLHTVLDSDKILVMSNGEVREFGSPQELRTQENSLFQEFLKESGIGSP